MSKAIFDFYRGRLYSAPSYGLRAGHQIVATVCRCAFHDSLLTYDEFVSIINLCELAHIKILEEDYNEGFNVKQDPQR